MNNLFVKIVHAVSRKIEAVSWVSILAMMVIVAANTISRRFNFPIYGTYDFACFLLVMITAPGLCRCAVEKGHISLDMLTARLPQKMQLVIGIAIDILSFLFCIIITYSLAKRCVSFFNSGQTGSTVAIPVWPFILVEAVSSLFLTIVFIADIVQSILRLRGGEAE